MEFPDVLGASRCPSSEPQDLPKKQIVVDQFGRRTVGGFRPVEICTPAWKLDIQGPDVIPVNP